MGCRSWISVLLLAILWGCAGTQPTVTPMPAPDAPHVEGHTVITFWHGETPALDQVLQQLIIDYQRSHPGVEIQVEAHGANLFHDYRQAVLAGGSPDLVLLSENRWVGSLADQGLIANISTQLDSSEYANITASALNGSRFNGKLYGLPLTLNVPVVFYRANVFTSGAPPDTTDEWLRVARSLKTSSQVGLAYNMSLYFVQPYLSAWGGEILDADGNVALTTAGYTATHNWLTWVRDLSLDPQLLARDDHRAISRAVQNNAVMTVDWAQNLSQYRQLWGTEVGIRPLPRLSATGVLPVPFVRSSVLAINPRSQPQQQEVALDLMRYLIAPPAQQTLRATGLPIVRRDLPVADDPLQQYIDQAADTGQPWPTSVRFNEQWNVLATMVRKVINGQPIDDTIVQTQRLLQN